jgi:anti-sigma factor RsiW
MSCLRINDIYEHIEGSLAPERRVEMERHLAACSKCRQAVEDRKSIAGAASSLEPLALPEDFTDRVMARIAPLKMKSPAWLLILASASSLLALTAVMIFASGGNVLRIISGAGHFLWELIKSAAVFTAKIATLLSVAGKAAQPLLEAAYKGVAVLTSFVHPWVQILIFVLAVGLVVTLFFGMRKRFLLGD